MTKTSSVYDLTESLNFKNGHFKGFIKELLSSLTLETEVERAVLWLNQSSKNQIKSYCTYSKTQDAFFNGDLIQREQHGFFLDILSGSLITSITETSAWENLKALHTAYFEPFAINGLLVIQVWNKGVLFGFLALETQKQARIWSDTDEMVLANAAALISQVYTISLNRKAGNFEENAPDFRTIFNDIPVPIWIFDTKSLKILQANDLVAKEYGYELEEFEDLSMNNLINGQDSMVSSHSRLSDGAGSWQSGEWSILDKNGIPVKSMVKVMPTNFSGKSAAVAVLIDINQQKENAESNNSDLTQKLADHAFYTSHYLRSPIANVLGLIDLIKISWEDREHYEDLIYRLKIQIMNLDEAIRVMTAKVELD